MERCYLAWISGRAFLRLDAVSFHWRCPGRKRQRPDDGEGAPDRPDFASLNGAPECKTLWKITLLMVLVVATLL